MKLQIKQEHIINKEAIEIVLNQKITRIDSQIEVINHKLLFCVETEDFNEHLIIKDTDNFETIDLSPFSNKHRNRYVRKTDDMGNVQMQLVEPEVSTELVDHSTVNGVFFVHQGQLGFLNLFNLYLWEDLNHTPKHYSIKKQLTTKQGVDSSGNTFYRDLNIFKVGKSMIDNEIPVIFGTYSFAQRTQHFSVLSIDNEHLTAEWLYLNDGMPNSLDIDEYPHTPSQVQYDEKPLIPDILWDGRLFTTSTWGCETKYIGQLGYDCKMLLQADDYGKRQAILYEPEHIFKTQFTAHLDYVIIRPYFKKDGKPYMFHLKTKQAISIQKPRGYADYDVFEVTTNSIWLKKQEADCIRILECDF